MVVRTSRKRFLKLPQRVMTQTHTQPVVVTTTSLENITVPRVEPRGTLGPWGNGWRPGGAMFAKRGEFSPEFFSPIRSSMLLATLLPNFLQFGKGFMP